MNEDPTEKLIKDLKEENEKLKAQLSGGKIDINEIKAMSGNENLSKEGNLSSYLFSYGKPENPVTFINVSVQVIKVLPNLN